MMKMAEILKMLQFIQRGLCQNMDPEEPFLEKNVQLLKPSDTKIQSIRLINTPEILQISHFFQRDLRQSMDSHGLFFAARCYSSKNPQYPILTDSFGEYTRNTQNRVVPPKGPMSKHGPREPFFSPEMVHLLKPQNTKFQCIHLINTQDFLKLLQFFQRDLRQNLQP